MGLFSWLTGADKAASALKKANKTATGAINTAQAKSDALMLPGANYQPAQNKLFDLLGLNGAQGQQNAFGAYQESPEVAFMREQGEGSLQRAAAAGGGLASGRTLADSQKFGQGLAQQGFGDFYSRLRDLYESTKGTAGGVAQGYTNTGNRLADIAGGYGQQRAQMAQQNSPWSVISGVGAIGADMLGSWMGKPKVPGTSGSIYPSASYGGPK